MEVTAKEDKLKRSSHGALYKVAIVLVVLSICPGFVVGLAEKHDPGLDPELVRRRLVALEETVKGLSKICKNDHQASPKESPTVYAYPSTITVMENSPVAFNCFATGQPAPSVRWERLGRGEVLAHDPSGALKITKAQSWHSGKYTCRAFNSLGMKAATVELKVSGKPVIREMFLSSRSHKITVNAYEDAMIYCHASGYPSPVVTWLKADFTNMPEGRTEITNDRLVIRKIRYDESAVYICRAQNYYGSVEMRYNVSVTPRGGRGRRDAARNCRELKERIPSTSSGRYWIDPDLGSTDNAYEAYCDQETDGGGWTLVWSFGYRRGKSSYYDRYMTPRPSIPTDSSAGYYRYMSPLSTTIPFNTSTLGAMDFSLWKTLGTEVLLQSNQINWYACKDGSGSIVNWADGSISCRVVKDVVDVGRCSNKAPGYFATELNYGMQLKPNGRLKYSYFYKVAVMESSSRDGGRKFDACGSGGGTYIRESYMKDDPRGAWFIR